MAPGRRGASACRALADGDGRTAGGALDGNRIPALDDDHAVEIRDHDELLGALSVTMPASDPMNSSKERLVVDLASQARLVLRSVRLIEELRASRQRLVAAQDDERRRIERNIHDGAQQQLVALAVKLRLAERLVERDAAEDQGAARRSSRRRRTAALEDLRDLARGIYPPLLADKGLVAALEAQARRAAVPVDGRPRRRRSVRAEIEAAVYFSCLEALQNVAKYAEASAVHGRPVDDGRPAHVPRDRRRPRVRSGVDDVRHGAAGDRRPAGGARRRARGTSAPGNGTTVAGPVVVGRRSTTVPRPVR